MGLQIDVKIELSAIHKRIVRGAVVVGASVGALGVGIAVAKPIDTAWIQSGQSVSSQKLVENLSELQAKVDKPLIERNGKLYSINATYCGSTASPYKGNLGGYVGAKALCQTACSGSPSAHMCTSEEVVRSSQLGALPSAKAWYASGTYVYYSPSSTAMSDCGGWTLDSTGGGARWDNAVAGPSVEACSTPLPVLCCD